MCGLDFVVKVRCRRGDGGTVVGLYVRGQSVPEDMFYRLSCKISWDGVRKSMRDSCLRGGQSRGFEKYSPKLAPMAGDGWDEAAWAAAGLPTSGDMLLQLHVHDVA
jgi:hypothetical protein